MVWVGSDITDHLVPTPLPWAGTPSTRPGCSKPHPTWPWTLPRRGQPQLQFRPLNYSVVCFLTSRCVCSFFEAKVLVVVFFQKLLKTGIRNCKVFKYLCHHIVLAKCYCWFDSQIIRKVSEWQIAFHYIKYIPLSSWEVASVLYSVFLPFKITYMTLWMLSWVVSLWVL